MSDPSPQGPPADPSRAARPRLRIPDGVVLVALIAAVFAAIVLFAVVLPKGTTGRPDEPWKPAGTAADTGLAAHR